MAKSAVTAERFAKGMTFDQYVKYAGSPENLAREAFGGYFPDGGSFSAPRKDNSAVFRDRYARARLSEQQAAAIKWLAAQPGGPAKILVISEDWSSDCRRDVPVLARLAEAGGMELRIFNRDGKKILGTRRPDPAAAPDANHDLMLEFMNGKSGAEWASVPVAVFYTADFRELHRYIEFPAIYHKDLIRGSFQAPRPGEAGAQTVERSGREFVALQASPFFDVWASAAIDEILSALHEKRVLGGACPTASSRRASQRARWRGSGGSSTRIGSPGRTSPSARTIPMTPALRTSLPSSSRASVAAIRPGWSRSSWAHGLRRPVTSTTAVSPRRRRAPVGNPSRSTPRVVTFSPMSPAGTVKPAAPSSSCSSAWIRCTWRRLGWLGSRATRERCLTVTP